MSDTVSISTGIAERYATAVFELAKEDKALAALEGDVTSLETALDVSPELRSMISSPVYSRDEQAGAIAAIAKKLSLSTILANTLALMGSKRRLFALPQLVAELRRLIAEEKGEVTAEVTAARELTKAQTDKLAETLKSSFGKDVKLEMSVDETLIGGLVVKVGSKMIDTSIRSKLNALQNSMKEVG